MRVFRFVSFLSVCALPVIPTGASAAFFGPEKCAVIVASRASLPEVQDYISSRPDYPFDAVYKASNGWFAISAGLMDAANASVALPNMRNSGQVPPDAYCSDGQSYTELVWASASDGSLAPSSGADPGYAPTQPPSTGAPVLDAPFDARALSPTDKRFLQAALALTGDYVGILDGDWGQLSQSAFSTMTRDDFQTEPLNVHAGYAGLVLMTTLRDEDWRWRQPDGQGVSILLPTQGLQLGRTNDGRELYDYPDRGTMISVTHTAAEYLEAVHTDLINGFENATQPYMKRQGDWITSGDNGTELYYMRSFPVYGGYTHVLLTSVMNRDNGTPLMIASMTGSTQPDPLSLPDDSLLLSYISQVMTIIEDQRAAEAGAAPGGGSAPQPGPSPDTGGAPPSSGGAPGAEPPMAEAPPRDPNQMQSSGTGFRVTEDGIAVTNNHVVEGCSRITLDGAEGRIIDVSSQFDIAIVQADLPGRPFLPFSEGMPRLNSDVTVVGYPFFGLLGGLNVTRGAISSLRGIQGDDSTMQISAPVQPGNSGGPVVDVYGNVVGVVVARLNDEVMLREQGSIGQNVNFAVRGEIAKMMLQRNRVEFTTTTSAGEEIAPVELADKVSAATVLIACY